MNRLARLIEELGLADLKLIQRDLEAGHIERLVNRRIEALTERKLCPTCGQELTAAEQRYTIEFGPRDLRQRAYFDELDCLEYFLKKLQAQGDVQSGHAITRPSARDEESKEGHA